MSDNLDLGRVPEGTETPEVLINSAIAAIDALFSEELSVDLAAGNGAVTLADLQRANFIALRGAATARSVTLPAIKRTLFARNYGTADVTMTRGAASVVIPAGEARSLRLSGAADGLDELGGGGGGGGGIEEAPTDGTLYGRKDGTWAAVPTGGGGGLPAGGTDGQYLAKLGAEDGEAEWRTLPAGGGGGGEGGGDIGVMPIEPPSPSLFNIRAGTNFDEIIGNSRVTTFRRTDNGMYDTQSGAFAGFAMPAGDFYFDATIRTPLVNPTGYITYALALRESSSGKALLGGWTTEANNPGFVIFRMNSMASFGSSAGKTVTRWTDYATVRIEKQGSFIRLYWSPDYGLTWIYVTQDVVSNGFDVAPDQIGVCHLHYHAQPTNYMTIPYMKITPR